MYISPPILFSIYHWDIQTQWQAQAQSRTSGYQGCAPPRAGIWGTAKGKCLEVTGIPSPTIGIAVGSTIATTGSCWLVSTLTPAPMSAPTRLPVSACMVMGASGARIALHSLQTVLLLPWSQIMDPPQSLHRDFCRPCVQRPLPPHSLHRDFCRPCAQRDPPPHSLHLDLYLLCSQMDAPPQSLHRDFCLLCSQ